MLFLLVSLCFCDCIEQTGIFKSQLLFTTGCVHILSSSFFNCHTEGSGGAVFVQDGCSLLLVSKCLFYSCKSTANSAGGICSLATDNNVEFTCFSLCSAITTGQAMHMVRVNTVTISQFSLFRCAPTESPASSGFRLSYGSHTVQHGNFSRGLSAHQSGYITRDYTDTKASYLSFEHLTAQSGIIYNNFESNAKPASLSHANFINNTQINLSLGRAVVYADNTVTTLTSCIFYANKFLELINPVTGASYVYAYSCVFDVYVASPRVQTDMLCSVGIAGPQNVMVVRFEPKCYDTDTTYIFSSPMLPPNNFQPLLYHLFMYM